MPDTTKAGISASIDCYKDPDRYTNNCQLSDILILVFREIHFLQFFACYFHHHSSQFKPSTSEHALPTVAQLLDQRV